MNKPVYATELGTLFQADCLDLLGEMQSGSVDLVFADPPFNLKKFYGNHYDDAKSEAEYVAWSKDWISECSRVLSPGGAFFIYNIPRWNVTNAQHMLDIGLLFRHWITIDIKFGLPIQGKLYPAHYSLLYFTQGKPRFFQRPRLPIQVCRHCGGDVKDYGGHRNKLHADGINLSDVWTDIPPVRHSRTKNRGSNELSEKLLERVLTIASEPGDMVFDPFGGSGTTFAVAERLHRHWSGCELGDVDPAVRRLKGEDQNVTLPRLGDAAKGLGRRKEALADARDELANARDEEANARDIAANARDEADKARTKVADLRDEVTQARVEDTKNLWQSMERMGEALDRVAAPIEAKEQPDGDDLHSP